MAKVVKTLPDARCGGLFQSSKKSGARSTTKSAIHFLASCGMFNYRYFLTIKYGSSATSANEGQGSSRQKTDSTRVLRSELK